MVNTDKLQYLSFGVMASMIEFMGACLDSDDFYKTGISRGRFIRAINEIKAFSKYRKCNDGGDHDLYNNLRCGMVHLGRPGKGIAFTEKSNTSDQDNHLKICTVNEKIKKLILVCEDLYSDLSKAAKELLKKMRKGDCPKT